MKTHLHKSHNHQLVRDARSSRLTAVRSMGTIMKKSIVLEIQRMATEKKEDISDLLRKALLVASKRKLNDFPHQGGRQ